jgi:hypothetical protein
MFENMVLRIFGPSRDKLTMGWRTPNNEELRKFYSSRGIVRLIKSRSMQWTGHVAWNERRGIYIGFLCGKARTNETTRKIEM